MKFRNVCLLVSFLFVNISISQVGFNDQATNLGINAPCGNTFLGNGITFFDYDNDGWDDITIASAQGYPIRFYKNINGNGNEVFKTNTQDYKSNFDVSDFNLVLIS